MSENATAADNTPASSAPENKDKPPVTRAARTAAYRPSVWIGERLGQVLDGRPRFNWLEAERMRWDPQVQLGLRILRAPLWGVTVSVAADSSRVQRWIQREFTHVYNKMLPHLCRHFEYGCAAGEVTYCTHRNQLHFEDFLEVHPRDATPYYWRSGRRAGHFVGLQVKQVHDGGGTVNLDRPHGFWFKGEAEFGEWYGRPRLAGAYEPWFEKRGRHGAVDARKLFYQKASFRGPRVRFPAGSTNMANDGEPALFVSNQDIARELVEKFERGGVVALPNVKIAGTSEFAWQWEDPQSFADVAGLLEYPKQLDKEILIGLGIPPELVDAATVGSGYSGRAIPAQVFFTSMDEVASLIVQAIDRLIIRWLVRANFGKVGYEIKPNSLAQLVAGPMQPPGPGQGGMPGADGPQPLPSPASGGPPGMVPYHGPHGGNGWMNPITHKVSYTKSGQLRMSLSRRARRALAASRPHLSPDRFRKLVLLTMCRAQLDAHKVGDPHAADAHLKHLAQMLAEPNRAARALRMSWVGATSRRGHLMAIGEGEHQGRVKYGKEAAAALRGQEKRGGQTQEQAAERGANAVKEARNVRRKALSYNAGPEDFKALAEHLPLLPAHEVRATRDALGASFRNTRRRDALVASLLAHVQELVDNPGQWSQETRQDPVPKERAKRKAAAGGDTPEGAGAGGPDDATTPQSGASKRLHAAIDATHGLSDEQRQTFHAAMHRATQHMPAAAHERIDRHLKATRFHTDTKTLGDAAFAAAMAVPGISPEGRAKLEAKKKEIDAGGGSAGGAFIQNTGELHIDGDHEHRKEMPGKYSFGKVMPAHEVYTHELGHVIDGPGHEISKSDEWRKAFDAEIKNPHEGVYPLTKYGASRPSEGLAEFSRLVYGSSVPTEQIEKDFPLASQVFKDRGLWPESKKDGAETKLSEGFERRVDLDEEGGKQAGHVDVLKPHPSTPTQEDRPAIEHPEVTSSPVRKAVAEAAMKLGGGREAVRVTLADLRKELPQFSHAEVTQAVRELSRARLLTLYPFDDPREIHGGPRAAEHRAAAIDSSTGVPQHLFYFGGVSSEGEGKKPWPKITPVPEPEPTGNLDLDDDNKSNISSESGVGEYGVNPNSGTTDVNNRLEETSGRGSEGGVHPRPAVGENVPQESDAGSSGTGAGTRGDGRTGVLSPSEDARREGDVRQADRGGDAAGRGEGTGTGGSAPRQRRLARVRKPDYAGPPRDAEGTRLGGGLDGHAPAIANPTPHEQSVAEPPAPDNPTDTSAGNFRYSDREFFKGGAKAKFAANLAAIRVLREIQAEGRETATPEEQAILSKFTGWGQFPGVFNEFWDNEWKKQLEASGISHTEWESERGKWAAERQALQSLLSPEEWEAAKRSTLNAHYTHPDVVDAHWKMAEKLGFKGGRYLETSAGIGYYLGLMPSHLAAKTRTSAVELDPTTGGMLKYLYPNANVNVQGFQEHLSPDHYYDLVASNVPFGGYRVHDPRYNKHKANIHDYFFLKSADKVKPGGLVMHITSTGTLDKADSKIREELAKTCDLVAAIRFPGAAHKENAGTDVVTDMIILRKRQPGEEPGDRTWLETTTVPDPAGGEPIPVNKYFATHPEQVLGTLDRTGSMYHGNAVNVSRTEDYDQRLQAAIDRLPTNILASNRAPAKRFEPSVLPAPGDVKEGGFHIQDGKVFVREGGGMTEQKVSPTQRTKIADHMTVRDAMRAVLNTESAGGDATKERAELNRVYDAFVKKHGPLNASANKKVFADDPDSPPLLALEKWDAKAKKAEKADIFRQTTVSAVKPVEKVGTVAEGVGVSLHERGELDVNHIAKLTGLHPQEVGKQLVASGLAFEDPSEGWKPSDQYLSGNVRRKLVMARAAAATDPRFHANVAALEKVQPEDIHHDDIDVKLGAPWVPAADIVAFAAHLLNASPSTFTVNYIPQTGEWKAEYSGGHMGKRIAQSSTAREVWGTGDVNFIELLQAALSSNPVTVTEADPTDPKKRIINREKTDAANQKVQEIKDEFRNWIWTDDARRERLHRHYNDNYNNIRPIKYDGSHLKLPGKNPAIDLRDHQKNFVWEVVTTGKGLAGHEVGTGKTYTMIAGAMELRRLGLARKPAIVCKKANVDAITQDALKLYPGAKILSTAEMFDEKSRKRTISKIATGDYDMVILTHDHLDLMAMRPETVQKYIREELSELEAAYEAAWEESGNDKNDRVVKQLGKAKENLEAKLKEALAVEKKDDAIHFEDTGIDHMFVDEAHRYKSLPVYTKMRGLKGVPTSRSDRATNMLMKTRWLMDQNGGRGVVFATGTPIANTMAELYNMQRYLQPKDLEERGIKTFDAWASTFGDVETKMEYTATGEYKPVSRFSKFVNIPELMQIAKQTLDVQRADDLKNPDGTPVVKRPKRKDAVNIAPKSDGIVDLMKELQDRASKLKGKRPGESTDNMLAICTDGRKGSIDLRMVDADAPDDPDSKANRMVANVLRLHKEKPDKTQMIFSEMGANPMQNGFYLFGDIIGKLVDGGIPREKIADFTKLDGKKKDDAVDAMRRGDILIGIGSTETLGTGVNAQHKLAALHHLDCPWRPADLEQRDGRGWRHGNENKEVEIHRYVTEGSLDELFWQGIARKSKFIKQIMTPGVTTERTAKEEDTEELTPEQIMAAASGDPRILEKVQVDEDVRTLNNAKIRHEREQQSFRNAIRTGEDSIRKFEKQIADYKDAAAHVAERPDFELKIGSGYGRDQTFTERKDVGDALDKAILAAPGYYTRIGKYRGLDIIKDNGRVYIVTPGGQQVETTGTLGSIEAKARQFDISAAAVEGTMNQLKKDLDQMKEKVGKPFAKAAEHEEKLKRQKQLAEELSKKGAAKTSDQGDAESVNAATTGIQSLFQRFREYAQSRDHNQSPLQEEVDTALDRLKDLDSAQLLNVAKAVNAAATLTERTPKEKIRKQIAEMVNRVWKSAFTAVEQ